MVHQISAQNANNNHHHKPSSPYTSNDNILNVGAPHKVTIPFDSQQPTVLSDEKKQQLMQSHPKSPPLPSSGKSIQGPIPGSQTPLVSTELFSRCITNIGGSGQRQPPTQIQSAIL